MTAGQIDLDAILSGGRRRSRLPWLLGLAATLLAVAVTVVLTRDGSTQVVAEPTAVEVSLGRIVSSTDFTGTASAPLLENLAFGVAGEVASVEVGPGDIVAEGDILATVETRDLEMSLREAELDLQLAQQRLNELLEDSPALAAQIASAQQSARSAEQRVTAAEEALTAVLSPSDAQVNAAYSLVQQRQEDLVTARDALDTLETPPTAEAILQAEAAVTTRETELVAAADTLAAGYTDVRSMTARILLNFDDTTRADQVIAALMSIPDPLLEYLPDNLDLSDRALEVAYRQSKINLEDAREDLADLQSWTPDDAAVATAERAVRDAEYALAEAQADLALLNDLWASANLDTPLGAAASTSDVVAAQEELEAAQSALEVSQLNLASTLDGAVVDGSDVTTQLLSVARAEAALETAQEALESAVLRAPFAGTVQSVSVEQGDQVAATTAVLVLLNEDQIEIDLTVTESDLPQLAVGQTGTATFSALSGQAYAVRITSISRVPSTEQGVVSYAATALITGVAPAGAVFGGGGLGGGAGALGGADGAGQDALLERLTEAGLSIPDGVSVQSVIQALIAGGDLPEGVTVPEGFSVEDLLPAGGQGRITSEGGVPTGPRPATANADGDEVALVMPAPGMSASVEITLSVGEEVVLAPTTAVRQIDGLYYVSVPGDDGLPARREVTIGTSDGTNVEILAGLDAGDTVLLGAETEGIPLSVTQAAQASTQGATGGGFGAREIITREGP